MPQSSKKWVGVYIPRTVVEDFLDGYLLLPDDLEEVDGESLADLLTRDEVPRSLGGAGDVMNILEEMGLQLVAIDPAGNDMPTAGDLVIILHPRVNEKPRPLIFSVPDVAA